MSASRSFGAVSDRSDWRRKSQWSCCRLHHFALKITINLEDHTVLFEPVAVDAPPLAVRDDCDLGDDFKFASALDRFRNRRTDRLRFMPTVQKFTEEGPEYQSLISYGRQIFQLCVGGLLFGSHLAQRSELHNKLTTNQERLELICKTLNDKSLDPSDRFTAMDDIVAAVDEYRYIDEPGLSVETMLGALQAAARNLLECDTSLDPAIKAQLSDLAMAKKSKDGYEILVALETWHNVMPRGPLEPRSPAGIMRRLTEIVWHYNFMPYFRMKKERENKAGGAASPPPSAGT
jgi:hypothetical protein